MNNNVNTTSDYITAHLGSFQQIENELGKKFTHDQRVEIAQLAMGGMNFYEAFDQVTGLTAELTPADEEGNEDLVVLRDYRGELIVKTTRGFIDDGFFVKTSRDSTPYIEATEEWLSDIDGIYSITEWM
ncbi:hypothetical protein [Corynebacterium sp. HMSC28B08]|uniref:hypothetical protein n=1 Tax=Corynebacterium TaxID=1716 RepID=UPI0008A543DC|nr:hypothetical protein [Corynebacterium sp. HMSC28B08]OFT89247.1 hypothetical protein HMPREF3098_05815 [Corynebacterium sp. HMSC28B08]